MIIGLTFSTIFGMVLISFGIGLFFGIIAGASLPDSEKKEKESTKEEKQ